ncbi:MAG TPA: ribonuclease Z [Prolixibacteraceae bacterium]|jgi:ribonuclease Z|nr:ribonuclease Z [Prolixibacteraceae bacterium]
MSFQLTILGTSSALPTSNRYPTAQVLNVLGRFFLIDCGEGTQTQMRKYKIGFSKIDRIFITHLHGDHIFGLIGLISTMILLGRDKDLHIYSHSELQKYLSAQVNFLYADEIPFRIIYHPLNFKSVQMIYEDKKVTIYSFPLSHRIPTCGFRFEEKPVLPNLKKQKLEEYNIPIRERQRIKEGGDFITSDGRVIPHSELTIYHYKARSFAFCSDTRIDESYIESVRNVDLLYHEATFAEDNQELANITYHSTGKDAATVALRAQVGKLLIGHFSARYKDNSPILEEAIKIFPQTRAIAEGDVIDVEKKLL